jgi:hypothetical protein
MNDNLPARSDLVLVAFMPNPRDMEIARILGWYRIPLRSAPKVVAVDWLAFYQPASFGKEHKWRIEWAAPVRGHELTTRMDLFKDEPDHPHAKEEYFKIQLGPLVPLPNPIMAGQWKRLTFLYTTGEYLLGAELVNDLTVRDEERAVLWQALRERALAHQKYEVQDLPDLPLDIETLAFLSLMAGNSPTKED